MSQPAVEPVRHPVLLIEDEAGVMAYVRAALERSGYEVVAASSGEEALELLKDGQFMGVVSDMLTPGGVDGAGVHAWISQHRPELSSKLVFITGDIANENTTAVLRKTGAPCV